MATAQTILMVEVVGILQHVVVVAQQGLSLFRRRCNGNEQQSMTGVKQRK